MFPITCDFEDIEYMTPTKSRICGKEPAKWSNPKIEGKNFCDEHKVELEIEYPYFWVSEDDFPTYI